MKLICNPLLFAIPAIAFVTNDALAQGPYRYTDLGDLGGGEAAAFGLNDAGEVVGWSSISGCTTSVGGPCRRAFHWKDGVMSDLGILAGDEESTARAINDLGQVVGTSESGIVAGSGTYHAVTWNGMGPVALPHLGGGTSSFAHDINDSGWIAGHATDPTVPGDRAVVWQGGLPVNAGATEPHTYNRAYGINELGHLAGFAWDLFSPNDAVLYESGWTTIGGTDSPWQNAEAYDVNDAGHKVGLQAFPSGNWHPAYWVPGVKGALDVGLLPGHDLGELNDVNESGIAVGRTYQESPPFDSRAILFDGKTRFDLNDLLPTGESVHLYEAREINEQGAIAGTALVGGKFRAFLLEPMPPWVSLGGELPGAGGAPFLQGFGELEGGAPAELRVSQVPAGAPVILVAGASQLAIPLLGGLLVPYPDQVFSPVPADAKGELDLGLTWPTGIAPGLPTFWQAWAVDATGPQGFTATNAVTALTQ